MPWAWAKAQRFGSQKHTAHYLVVHIHKLAQICNYSIAPLFLNARHRTITQYIKKKKGQHTN